MYLDYTKCTLIAVFIKGITCPWAHGLFGLCILIIKGSNIEQFTNIPKKIE